MELEEITARVPETTQPANVDIAYNYIRQGPTKMYRNALTQTNLKHHEGHQSVLESEDHFLKLTRPLHTSRMTSSHISTRFMYKLDHTVQDTTHVLTDCSKMSVSRPFDTRYAFLGTNHLSPTTSNSWKTEK